MSTQSISKTNERCSQCLGTGVETRAGRSFAVSKLCSECMSPCTGCGGAGEELIKDEAGYDVVRMCGVCGSAKMRIKLFDSARIPPRYHASMLRNYRPMEGNQAAVKSTLVRYLSQLQSDPRGMLLIGDPGVGKTHLLSALVRALTVRFGVSCAFIEFSELLSRIKVGYESGRTEEQIIGPLVRVPVLAIDDMGKGSGSEWEMVILDALISRRYNARRPVLISTNYHLKDPLNATQVPKRSKERFAERAGPAGGRTRRDRVKMARTRMVESLEERVGARVASRLGEMCQVLVIEAQDYRKKGLL